METISAIVVGLTYVLTQNVRNIPQDGGADDSDDDDKLLPSIFPQYFSKQYYQENKLLVNEDNKCSLNRPTIKHCREKYQKKFCGKSFDLSKNKNKGKVGLWIENKLDVPQSSECLDCVDGEIKAFEVEYNSKGNIVPKETIAITLMKPNGYANVWSNERLFKKIKTILYLPFIRDPNTNNVQFLESITINISSEYPEILERIKNDYETIKYKYSSGSPYRTCNGDYIQVRTKGQGGKTPKTYAYYFRKSFINKYLIQQIRSISKQIQDNYTRLHTRSAAKWKLFAEENNIPIHAEKNKKKLYLKILSYLSEHSLSWDDLKK